MNRLNRFVKLSNLFDTAAVHAFNRGDRVAAKKLFDRARSYFFKGRPNAIV